MSLIIVETNAEQPLTTEVLNAIAQRVSPCLKERDVKWRFSLLSSDRYCMLCTYEAPDAESVREAYRKGRRHSSRT
ncbi:MAG: nickel-binding protein [Stenomitos frigidus ULC029]